MDYSQFCLKPLAAGFIFSGVLALGGCGGGSSDSSSPAAATTAPITLTGTAAGGIAIAGGTVTAKCASGTGTATTAADGTYTLTFTGTPPCMLQVTDPNNAANVYYSAVDAGTTTANITPLTTLVVANALGADPATAYAGFSSTTASNITSSTLSAAVTNVSTALASSLNITIPSGTNPLTATFTAATEVTTGSALDSTIDALVTALAAANTQISTLTAALASSTTASAAAAAVAQAAATSNIATSALANCPYAPSGQWLVGTIGAQSFKIANLDFSKMTGAGGTDPANPTENYTITQTVDSSNNPIPCAFQLTSTSTANPFSVDVRVSKSGVAAAGATLSAAVSVPVVPLSTTSLSIAFPLQSTLAIADLAGNWNGVSFGQNVLPSKAWVTSFAQLAIDSSGNVNAYDCGGGLTCSASVQDSAIITRNAADPGGVFTATGSDGSVSKIAGYKSANGDMIMLALSPSDTVTYGNQYNVFSKRVSPIIRRAAGTTYTAYVWIANNAGSGALQQSAKIFNYTVNSATANSITRTDNVSGIIDTIDYDDPRPYMARRPAIAATATQAAVSEWILIGGVGWSAIGSTSGEVAPSPTAPAFLDIAINPVQ